VPSCDVNIDFVYEHASGCVPERQFRVADAGRESRAAGVFI
jgi:hypothetical protein